MQSEEPTAAPTSIDVYFELFNNGTAQLDFANITMRYYFLAQGDPSLVFACDFAGYTNGAGGPSCNGGVTGTFVSMGANATAQADTYLELSFASAPLPGGSGLSMDTRIHDVGYAFAFDQANDWSAQGSTSTTFTEATNITAYLNGTRVWGVEP